VREAYLAPRHLRQYIDLFERLLGRRMVDQAQAHAVAIDR
jgi:hypothetical protein